MTGRLEDHIAGLSLVDNHVHGYWTAPVDRRRFENRLNEANTEALADFDSGFDTQLGFAVRAHCAPLLGIAAHAEADDYWTTRASLQGDAAAQTFLRAAGVSDWLVDTGLSAGVAGVAQLADTAAGGAHEIVRLEQIAEDAIRDGGDYARTFDALLHHRTATAMATKTVLAYRGGFAGDLSDPTDAEVAVAAQRWRDAGGGRLTDRVLVRFGIHRALRLGLPLQFHVGLGDRDCDLDTTNPLLLLDFLRAAGDTPIVLLHCYPYEREAGYLAQAFNNVYLDTGLSVNHLGARSADFLARTLELAPFRKILYSSDAYGPPELHYLGSRLWRDGMSAVLGDFVAQGHWSVRDAMRVASLIGRDNALRLYRL